MLLNIKTNNATNIVINLPSDKIAYVQNVVDLFEQNAVFVNAAYSNIETVKPFFDITLGSSVVFNKNYHDETELAIASDKTVVIEDFEVATPEVLTSNKKAVESLKAKLKKQEDENKCLQMTIDKLNERIEEMLNKSDTED
jgi:hypothetical protein